MQEREHGQLYLERLAVDRDNCRRIGCLDVLDRPPAYPLQHLNQSVSQYRRAVYHAVCVFEQVSHRMKRWRQLPQLHFAGFEGWAIVRNATV